jgi:hypothetical protein
MEMTTTPNSNVESENYTPEARAQTRSELEADIEKFLSSGGRVDEIAKGERADPPRKPENNYGRGSI